MKVKLQLQMSSTGLNSVRDMWLDSFICEESAVGGRTDMLVLSGYLGMRTKYNER
jgi:hypothetical protein